MRTKNSFINFLANEGSIIVNIILSFITRTVFIYTLGKAYLGVNGLFANVPFDEVLLFGLLPAVVLFMLLSGT